MGKLRRGAAIVGLFALVVSGCSLQAAPLTQGDLVPDIEPLPELDTLDVDKEGTDASTINLVGCDNLEQQLVEIVIRRQTEAFEARDFDTAYSMASPSFRDSVPLEAFRQLIDSSYGPLLESTNLSFDSCLIERQRDFATIDARFSRDGQDVFLLRYVVSDTEEGWRVNAASNLELVGVGA